MATESGAELGREKCHKPTKYHLIAGASHYACVLDKGHEGECQPGGNCFKHGEYVGALQCPKWPDCIAGHDSVSPKVPVAWQIRSGRRIYLFAKEPVVEAVYEFGGVSIGDIVFDEVRGDSVSPTMPTNSTGESHVSASAGSGISGLHGSIDASSTLDPAANPQVSTNSNSVGEKPIDLCADLVEDGTPWESAAEPDPEYFATLREAIDFQFELCEREAKKEGAREAAKFLEALKRYGTHEVVTGVSCCASFDGKPCNCGFDALLSSYEAGAERGKDAKENSAPKS